MILLIGADLSRDRREIVRDSRLVRETDYFIQGSNHRCQRIWVYGRESLH